jgi:hypothetical protein
MKMPTKLVFLLTLPFASFGQKTVTPGSSDINTSYLKSEQSLYTIYYVKGETWTKKGTYKNDLTILGNELKLTVNYRDDKDQWYRKRSSTADAKTLSPLAYQSETLKSKIDLKFGNSITGKTHDLTNGKEKQVLFNPKEKFVDFNVAEYLFSTLPLKVGYKAVVPEFYYVDHPDSILSNYIVKDVKSYIHYSPKTGSHETWLVSVLEEGSGAIYTYIIDKKDHRIWQREMPVGGGTVEICVNEELDYQPIKNKFSKEETLQQLEKGSSVIVGTAFARDHNARSMAVVNINKAQYAPKGTVVSILPNSPYIQEWKEVNRKIRKGKKKLPEVPIDPAVGASMKRTKVYDDKGHFEFTNLMPGEYILLTSFGYTHQYSYSYYAGSSNLVHPSGAILSSSPVYKSAYGATGARAEIEAKVTIRKDGDTEHVNLKDVR